ncbi:MAG: CoA-binding protein [Chloroflexi bacterium]|nr:CoA-binding protein [Chloroflexota bacterium]
MTTVDKQKLHRVLSPRTVAVVGDKKSTGYRWLRAMEKFRGKVYSVQIDPNEVPGIEAMGVPNYQRLMDIPDEVDYVVLAVPRAVAPRVLRDAVEKKVGGVAMFTSGFAETDTKEGVQLQNEVKELARRNGLVIVGPNCMGVYNPSVGLRFGAEQPTGFSGPVAFISQSGGHTGSFSLAAHANGIAVGLAVSFGNGVMLESVDYLEYFAQDPDTKYIAMYIEGVRDGRRLFRVLRETTPHKPVVVWKGGVSEAGQRATASHTASLGGAAVIWDAMCRQAGAIQVTSLEELVDVLQALVYLPPFTGDGVGITGGSGGQSVSLADDFSRAGLRVPTLTQASYYRLASFFSLVGASYRNPIDLGSNRTEIETILDVLSQDPNVDIVVMQLTPQAWRQDQSQVEAQVEALIRHRDHSGKPAAGVLFSPMPLEEAELLRSLAERLRAVGVPVFPSYARAARAIKKALDYHRFHRAEG